MASQKSNPIDVGHIVSCLNAALASNSSENSISNAFKIELHDRYFDFVPTMPSPFILNADLNRRIYQIVSGACYPYLTFLPTKGPYFVPTDSSRVATARALRFEFIPGQVERLYFEKLSDAHPIGVRVPLMKGLDYDTNTGNGMICVSGISGGGKTVFCLYLLQCFIHLGEVDIVDPKMDQKLHYFAKSRKVRYFAPDSEQNDSQFIGDISALVKEKIDLIHDRQRKLLENPAVKFSPNMLFIDEMLALTSTISKRDKDLFLGLLTKVCVMGRATKVGVIISGQEMSADVISTAARDQMTLKVLLTPNVNRESCRFMFKELDDPSSIVVPNDGKSGRGIIQIVHGNNNVLPFMSPIIKNLG